MFPWWQESWVALKNLPQEGSREVSAGSLRWLQGWFYLGGGVGEEKELIFMSHEHHILQLSALLPHLFTPRLVEFLASEPRRGTEVLQHIAFLKLLP